MSKMLRSPKRMRAPSANSPIASKSRTKSNKVKSPKVASPTSKKRGIVSSLLKRLDNQQQTVVSSNAINENNKSTLFSPKYEDTISETLQNEDENNFNSPPPSPLRKREMLDADCARSVAHIKQCVWNSANDDIDGFLFMKYAPPLSASYFKNRKTFLPKNTFANREYTLVLDLDETLVHCSVDKVEDCDLIFPVVFNGDSYKVYMKKRPYFKQFLQCVSELFEVVIFTASQQCYADKLLNLVDPDHKYIHHRLFRDHCINVEGNFVKDLRVLGRDLSKTIIIDNSPPAFTYQIENGLPIVSWYDDPHDQELKYMVPVLRKLMSLQDVRPAIKKYFQIKKLLKSIRMTL